MCVVELVRHLLHSKPATEVGASDRRKSSSMFDAVNSTPHLNHHDRTDFSTDSLHEVLHRQNKVTEMLIKQQNLSQLPQRDISTFTGDPLIYRSFISHRHSLYQEGYGMASDKAGRQKRIECFCFVLGWML